MTIDASAHASALSNINLKPPPTPAQISAGNYPKGHHRVAGLDISVENPAGSVRKPEYPVMTAHYGYIRGTVGADGDHLDVFVKVGTPDDWQGNFFVADMADDQGKFAQHKVMIGYNNVAEARRALLNHFSRDWHGRLLNITQQTQDQFKQWETGDLSRPCAKIDLAAALLKSDRMRDELGRFAAEASSAASKHDAEAKKYSAQNKTKQAVGHREVSNLFSAAAKSFTSSQRHLDAGRKDMAEFHATSGDRQRAEAEGLIRAKNLALKVVLSRSLFKVKRKTLRADKKVIEKHHKNVAASLKKYFAAQAKVIIPQLVAGYTPATKTVLARALLKATPEDLVAKVKLEGWEALVDEEITPEVEAAFNAAGMSALASVGVEVTVDMTDTLNTAAADYAETMSAELVTQIEDSTRNMIRDKISQAVNGGWDSEMLADELEASRAFSPERAVTIASYELGSALEAGNLVGWQTSGVVTGKQWVTAEDDLVSDECQANADQGVIPLDDAFQSGDDAPLAHPFCRCSCVGVTDGE